jgi:hypothetical protein
MPPGVSRSCCKRATTDGKYSTGTANYEADEFTAAGVVSGVYDARSVDCVDGGDAVFNICAYGGAVGTDVVAYGGECIAASSDGCIAAGFGSISASSDGCIAAADKISKASNSACGSHK